MYKLFFVCALIGFASALSPYALKAGGHRSSHSSSHISSHSSSGNHASSDDVHAEVKSLHSDVRADGFDQAFDTTNGISQSSSGDEHGNVHGSYSWISPEGQHIQVNYIADENGYQPSSDLLPTPPPIPEAIVRALAYIAAHPQQEEKYTTKYHH